MYRCAEADFLQTVIKARHSTLKCMLVCLLDKYILDISLSVLSGVKSARAIHWDKHTTLLVKDETKRERKAIDSII